MSGHTRSPRPRAIAIVGLGGIFPESPDLDTFWRNVRDGRDCAREAPEGRWILSAADAEDPQVGTPDRVYSRRGCFIDDLPLDLEGLDLDPDLLARLDPLFHLALHASRQALGSARTEHLDPRSIGVIFGNIALPTEKSSALSRSQPSFCFLGFFCFQAPSPSPAPRKCCP